MIFLKTIFCLLIVGVVSGTGYYLGATYGDGPDTMIVSIIVGAFGGLGIFSIIAS